MVYQTRMFTRANAIGFVFLLLLSCHEVLVVARNIQAHSQLNSHRRSKLQGEVNDLAGLYRVLQDSFDFPNSPMRSEIETLKIVDLNFLEMPSREGLSSHYAQITSFLEKAMSHVDAKVDVEELLDSTEQLESTLKMKDFAWSAVFGTVNGFFSGMASDFRENYRSPLCQDGLSNVGEQTKAVTHAFKHLWHTGKTNLLKIKPSLKVFLRAIYRLLRAVSNYMLTCEATKPLVIFSTIMLGAFALNLLLMSASGFMPLAILLKIVGMVVGLYFASGFFIQTVKSLYKRIRDWKHGKCDKKCKSKLVEHAFEMIGCAIEVVLLGGVTEILKFSRSSKAAKGMRKLKIELHPAFVDDLKILANAAKSAKQGLGVKISSLNFKTRFTKKQSAWKKYKAKKMQAKKKPLSYEAWESKYDNLVKARNMKAHYKYNPMDKKYNNYRKNFRSGKGKNKKTLLTRRQWDAKMLNLKHFRHQDAIEKTLQFESASSSVSGMAKRISLAGMRAHIKGLRKLSKSGEFKMKIVGDAMDANDIAGSESPGATNKVMRWQVILSNMREHTAWNSASAKQLTEEEMIDAKEEKIEDSYGVIGKCSGDVDGLCFDVRKSACSTGRKVLSNRCKGDKYILCCPGAVAEIEKHTGA